MKKPIHNISKVGLVLATSISTIAIAQTNTPTPTNFTPASADASTVPGNNDIIVTGTRRSQRTQDVPGSLTVQSGAALAAAGVTNTRELTLVTPGLNFSLNGGFAAPTVRGVSAQATGPGAENNVAIYMDGIYQASQLAGSFDFPDVERIEVLKGPQGTLYGRNATGGAILIVTRDPSYTASGKLSASYGRFDDAEFSGFVTAPLVDDRAAFSLTGYYRNNDGFNRDVVSGQRVGALNSMQFRGKLRLDLVPGLTTVISGYYSERKDASPYTATLLDGNTAARRINPAVIVSGAPNTTALDFPSYLDNKSHGFTIKNSIDLPIGTITALTGADWIDSQILTDADYTAQRVVNYDIRSKERSWSQDLNFASRRWGPLTILAGASYFHHVGAYDPLNVIGVLQTYAEVKTDAFAAYLEGNIDFTDRLTAIVGARYSYEEKSLAGSRTGTFPPLAGRHWRDLTPRFVLKYRVSDDVNLYASYTEGFKSGTFNSGSLDVNAVDPEKIRAYEAGVKTGDIGIFRFNVAAFHYDYSNIQVAATQLGFSTLQNAATAKIQGMDFDVTATPIQDLVLKGGFSLLDAKYEDFPAASINVPRPAFDPLSPTTTCPINAYPCGNIATTIDASGNWLPRAAKWTANFSAGYGFDLGSGRVTLNGTVFFSDGFYWEVGNRVRQSSYEVVNARIGWMPERDIGLTLSLWGKNLTNSHYGQAANITTTVDVISFAAPRTYGVAAAFAF